MEWSLRVGGARVCVEGRLRWHPGYFKPCVLDTPVRGFLRSMSDQTPSPTCLEALFDESIFLKGSTPPSPNRSSASSSPNITRLSHSTCVSDSSVSSSDASASGDKLKKRRKYRKRRSIKRRQPTQAACTSEKTVGQAESPSAVYCEEWIYSSTNSPPENKRMSFPGFVRDANLENYPTSERRRSLEGDDDKNKNKNTSWFHVWQNLLKIAPKPKNKVEEPICVEINPPQARQSVLPSISEAEIGQSETQSSVSLINQSSSSASSSVTACNIQSNPTNQEVCFTGLTRAPLVACFLVFYLSVSI